MQPVRRIHVLNLLYVKIINLQINLQILYTGDVFVLDLMIVYIFLSIYTNILKACNWHNTSAKSSLFLADVKLEIVSKSFLSFSFNLLVKNTGECIVCYEEGEVVSLPCHSSHMMCEQCTLKIIFSRQSLCPMCILKISFRKWFIY